ncbi:calcium/sodium antiporter [Tolumonas osonensis]|uniref:Cation:H+ antiporter n=1 Tax=Tolumonas osonensis TaxID=675874 RepID=A0A841GLS9_9GAMM|nr:calcium/sodium antiporter [Tolumonas osonensis]MBB6055442.1 cation:H+ antiporter [Tolumonas osonensis]
MGDYIALVLGILSAAIGGELFVRGTVGIAYWARISPGIVAATVAAFATSSPELTVSVTASLLGTPQIALGDALGSNVVNIALILGIAIAITPLYYPRDSFKRDYSVALLVPGMTGLFMLDGALSRIDGLIMLMTFIAWLIAVILEVRKQRNNNSVENTEKHRIWASLLQSVVGLAFLIAAGRLIVSGATGIMQSLGVDAFVIGATVVALGTSAPELAMMIVATLRRHDDIALGTVLGSNIFNGLLIVSLAAIISPITIVWSEIMAVLLLGILSVVCIFPSATGYIERRQGYLLLVLYLVYLVVLAMQPWV